MKSNSNNEIIGNIDYYQALFQLLKIHPLANGGYSWKLGGDGPERQLQEVSGRTRVKPLDPKETAIVAIAISRGPDDTPEQRVEQQQEIINLGIVKINDIIDMMRRLIRIADIDHITKEKFRITVTENIAKVCLLIGAYETIHHHLLKNPDDFSDPEYTILLAYIIAILSHQYELRPYMINENFTREKDWVEIYDELFDGFSDSNREMYNRMGVSELWYWFKLIRDDIYSKKSTKRLITALNSVANITVKIISELRGIQNTSPTQSPPSASNRPQDPQSP